MGIFGLRAALLWAAKENFNGYIMFYRAGVLNYEGK